MIDPDVSIRRARPEDAAALTRLGQLDSSHYDGGPALVAESAGGELLAAVGLGPGAAGRSFANPFRYTAEVVTLLELRVAQLEGLTPARPSRPRRLLRAARRPRRYRAPA